MSELLTLLSIITPILCGFGMYIMYGVNARLTHLEHTVNDLISEEEVRNILHDNLNPIRDDIRALEHKIDKLVELLINGRNIK